MYSGVISLLYKGVQGNVVLYASKLLPNNLPTLAAPCKLVHTIPGSAAPAASCPASHPLPSLLINGWRVATSTSSAAADTRRLDCAWHNSPTLAAPCKLVHTIPGAAAPAATVRQK